MVKIRTVEECKRCKENCKINAYGCSICKSKPVIRMLENYVVEVPNRTAIPVQDM
jgi:hypothetical protein